MNKYLYFTGIEDFEGKEYKIIKTTEIVKHSRQLIDLIEVGDFVNGKEVIEIRKINEKIYLMTDYCPQNYIKTNIKTILTKERYMSNCYKVGGEENETSND